MEGGFPHLFEKLISIDRAFASNKPAFSLLGVSVASFFSRNRDLQA